MAVSQIERLTKRARSVLSLAQQEAEAERSALITAGHVLVALALEDGCVAQAILRELNISADQLRGALPPPAAMLTHPTQSVDLADEVRRLLEYSVDEARSLSHHYVGTEHLLLGTLRLKQGTVTALLEACGTDANSIRQTTLALLRLHSEHDHKPKRKPKRDAPPLAWLSDPWYDLMQRIIRALHALVSDKPER